MTAYILLILLTIVLSAFFSEWKLHLFLPINSKLKLITSKVICREKSFQDLAKHLQNL